MGRLIDFPQPNRLGRTCMTCQHYRSVDLHLANEAPEFGCLVKWRMFNGADIAMGKDCNMWERYEFVPDHFGT